MNNYYYPTLKQIELRLKHAKTLLKREYLVNLRNCYFDARHKQLIGNNGYYLQYLYPSSDTGSLGACELFYTKEIN
jgi:hypothetical protein